MKEAAPSHGVVRFSGFEVDLRNGEVRKHGSKIRLQDQPFHVLQILLEHPGELVTREELQRQIWPADTFVDFEKGLNNAIKRLRDALGDSAEQPRFIETHARRGYRFIGSVTAVNGAGRADKGASPVEVGALTQSRPLHRRLAIGAVLFLAFVATLFGLDIGGVRQRLLIKANPPAIHSLAVLPLTNLSEDHAQEYFSDGMTDALITKLAQIGSLKVISRTSSMQYKQTNKSLPEIARELNVDGIIEGTVQRSGAHVSITAQLIHGPSDKHLWASSYERDLDDVLMLEREVASDIAHQVQTHLTAREQVPIASPHSANLKSYEAYLQGNYHLNRWGKGAGDEEKRTAAEYFQQSIDADPNFAPAYVGLARAHWCLIWPSRQDAETVVRAAERALVLDANSSDAHEILAETKWRAWKFPTAEEEYRRAIELNPSNAEAHHKLGWVLEEIGRWEDGWKEQQIAQELDPASDYLSYALDDRRQIDRAIPMHEIMLKRSPDDGNVHVQLTRDYLQKGMYDKATLHAEQVWTLFGFPQIASDVHRAFLASSYRGTLRESANAAEHLMATDQSFLPVNIAEFYAALGDKDRAFYWLEQAYVRHDIGMVSTDLGLEMLNAEFLLDPLRSDPRFRDLLHRVGLPELQLKDAVASSQQNGHN